MIMKNKITSSPSKVSDRLESTKDASPGKRKSQLDLIPFNNFTHDKYFGSRNNEKLVIIAAGRQLNTVRNLKFEQESKKFK